MRVHVEGERQNNDHGVRTWATSYSTGRLVHASATASLPTKRRRATRSAATLCASPAGASNGSAMNAAALSETEERRKKEKKEEGEK